MKILLIDNFHYRRGGAEVVYLNTGDMLQAHGHEVVWFSQKWEENVPSSTESYFPEGVNVNTDHSIKRLKGLINYFYNNQAAKSLKKLIDSEHPDIAHVHLFWGGLSTSILKVLKQAHIPVVHTVHDYRMVCPGYSFKDGYGRVCEKCHANHFTPCIYNKCAKGNIPMSIIMTMEMYFRNTLYHPSKYITAFIFVSRFSRDKHIEHDPKFASTKNRVLYNFSNRDISLYVDLSLSTFNSYYLYYGRLSFEKGLHTLILGFSKHKDKCLKIVGAGPLEEELKKLCNEKSITNVEFLGYKTGEELYDIVRRAKFVCVSSECYENNPMTIIESFTLGVPVIGASIGGITEIVEDGKTGFLFESGNIASLEKAIGRSDNLCIEEYQNMKIQSKQFADYNFNQENYYKSLLALYNEVICNY